MWVPNFESNVTCVFLSKFVSRGICELTNLGSKELKDGSVPLLSFSIDVHVQRPDSSGLSNSNYSNLIILRKGRRGFFLSHRGGGGPMLNFPHRRFPEFYVCDGWGSSWL